MVVVVMLVVVFAGPRDEDFNPRGPTRYTYIPLLCTYTEHVLLSAIRSPHTIPRLYDPHRRPYRRELLKKEARVTTCQSHYRRDDGGKSIYIGFFGN